MVRAIAALVYGAGIAMFVGSLELCAQSVNTARRSALTTSLRATIDTTISPCDDFEQFANGAWRTASDSNKHNILEDALAGVDSHLTRLLDSAKGVAFKTKDPTLRALGTFYASCLAADSLPRPIGITRIDITPSGRKVTTRVDECVGLTQQVMSRALYYVYVQDVMRADVSLQSRTLVANIRAAVREQVQSIGWIGDSVQRKLTALLDTMTMRIQLAPDTVDHTRLVLHPTQYVANLAAIAAWEKAEHIRRRDSLSVRRTTMEITLVPYAPIVQAQRGFPIIEVTPLFFQPPFFDIAAEPAANYATLGFTLAHEMWHLLTPSFKWMNNTEGRRRVSVLVEHYAKFDQSGWNTANEDLSDLGGILSAYTAWQKNARKMAIDRIEGFTPEQRFFLYYARSWRSVDGLSMDRDHSGMRTRVNGTLMHVPAFAKAFGCAEPNKMVVPQAKRTEIF